MSRLLNNEVISELRKALLTRNLYNPTSEYNLENPKIANQINTISNIINPGNAFDITNNIIGRVLSIGPQTKLVQIGNEQLAKQFLQHSANRISTDIIPEVSFSNIFDGNPDTKFLNIHQDYSITSRDRFNIVNFIDSLFGTQLGGSPLPDNVDNSELIRNTGRGQLEALMENINRNRYQPSESSYIKAIQSQRLNFEEYHSIVGGVESFVFNEKDYDNFPEARFANEIIYNEKLNARTLLRNGEEGRSYNKNIQFGNTNTRKKEIFQLSSDEGNYESNIDNARFGHDNSISSQLVWDSNDLSVNPRFNVKDGILNYTKNLLLAKTGGFSNSKNTSIDLTKKTFYNKGEFVGFNGSGVGTKFDGIRQHVVNDQYNRYAKAIRFNGNIQYNGNENSVIYRSVLPKIHPTMNGLEDGVGINNGVDVRNMMFSIENLAYSVTEEGDIGDEFNTVIPKCEIGPNKGRIMWFPPYDIQLSETDIAKHETTEFIGRPEPIYTYNNSERIATLSFKMIIDHPPQVKGMDQRDASEFFAYGGTDEPIPSNIDISSLLEEKARLKNKLDDIKGVIEKRNDDLINKETGTFYYINDYPLVSNPNGTGINQHKSLGYEDGINGTYEDNTGDDDFGLNKLFDEILISLFGDVNEGIVGILNEDNYKFYSLQFKGYASKLFTSGNKSLSERRADDLKNYAESFFISHTDYSSFSNAGINTVNTEGFSDTLSGDEGELAKNKNLRAVKKERRATIAIIPNGIIDEEEQPLTPEQRVERQQIIDEINSIDLIIARAKRQKEADCIYDLKRIDETYSQGFEDVMKNKYQPAFHSQTPEDFHRRLTFLHQCTRPGNAIKSLDNKGIPSPRNTVFGRPPVAILRLGDFLHTKIIIDNITYDYIDSPWDTNPEGMGMQYMIADITMGIRLIGGQSLQIAIDAIQNATSFNYYANSTFYDTGVYRTAGKAKDAQVTARDGIGKIESKSVPSSSIGGVEKPELPTKLTVDIGREI